MGVQRKEILKSHVKIQITDFLDYLWQQNNPASLKCKWDSHKSVERFR